MKLRKIYTSAGILLLSLFCIGDAVAKDAKFETGVSFGSTGADEPYSSLTDKDGNVRAVEMWSLPVELRLKVVAVWMPLS
ncbi:hypothetical protein [Barnesiella intestinihominis]|uniref:hypothetical protein n=1 Tax=Barnesiella intestinihominis TaxID=487174 RepID=UPI003AB553AF